MLQRNIRPTQRVGFRTWFKTYGTPTTTTARDSSILIINPRFVRARRRGGPRGGSSPARRARAQQVRFANGSYAGESHLGQLWLKRAGKQCPTQGHAAIHFL